MALPAPRTDLLPEPSEEQLAAMRLSDAELIREIYTEVLNVQDDPDNADRLYFLLEDAFERFAPEAEWEHRREQVEEQFTVVQAEDEMRVHRLFLRGRRIARLHAEAERIAREGRE